MANWKPSWISSHEPNVGLVIDDHCFLVLLEQEDGSWKPTTWIPRAGVELIRRYSSQLDEERQMTHFEGDDCPGGHRLQDPIETNTFMELLKWKKDYGSLFDDFIGKIKENRELKQVIKQAWIYIDKYYHGKAKSILYKTLQGEKIVPNPVYVGPEHEHVFTPNHFCVVCGVTNG